MAKREPKIDSLSYEQAIEQLEELIERIESGEIGLEESLKQYETGMALISRCRTILSAAETKIAELTVTSDGGLRTGVNDDDEEPLEAETEEEEDDAEPPI